MLFKIENLEIIDAGAEGKSVGKKDGLTVFVPFAVPGDIVDVEVFKKKKGYAEARIVSIKTKSQHRVEQECAHFGLCGGCKWQILDYETQLKYKQKQVEDAFHHLGKFEFSTILPIIPSKNRYAYRNKLEFTFSHLRWLDDEDMLMRNIGNKLETNGLGFHIPGKFDKVLNINNCLLQAEPSNEIRNSIRTFAIEHNISFYNIRNHEGILRNLIIRNNKKNEMMLILSLTEMNNKTKLLLDFLVVQFPQITSLFYVLNTKLNDSISDLEPVLYSGAPFISETLDGIRYKIGPLSFFQTNSLQALELFNVAREFAQLTPKDIVYDLYTGTGTIALFVAKYAQKVVGIEYAEAAIEDAKYNALQNGIHNTVFFSGDIKEVLNENCTKRNGKPDIVITDPPRAGMHSDVVLRLLEMEAPRMVYISCNPATQARDLTELSTKYFIEKVQPVDMFPHTHHVENVVGMRLKT
ncbi:MAG: 23S rRNA (uracil(1939)-C(5))-methyltransferase RlmD [Bacteroidales bacterium]|jgi:23S rRNA (uracil1939-C5)-methyltransferase|nr:23S rRNA (uracil(1939)-C(5))-methyltransferase RlmD [Bacteroidales bacterium]